MKQSNMITIAHAELTAAKATITALRDQATRGEDFQRRSDSLERLGRTYFEMSSRMTSAAGKATTGGPSLGRVKLSVKIFTDERNAATAEADLRGTIRHELAHIAAPSGEKHGPIWVALAKELGDTGERCHEMAVTRKARYDWKMSCDCCGTEIGTIRNRNTVARFLGVRRTRCCSALVIAEKI